MINNVSKDDWQYLLPFLICLVCFLCTDLLGIWDKNNLAYWSGELLAQPHRIITFHFIHADAKHLLLNSFGIAVCRYCLKGLSLKSNLFFSLLVIFLLPTQTMILWLMDIFVFKQPMSLAVGFSGILYGIYSYILLASILGKKRFLWIEIDLRKHQLLRKTMSVLIAIGVIWSLLPGISLSGHLAGLVAGSILFLL